eukprot:m.433097 g.433097  ORF g.433097 m.433097 type:complete len:302 (+) comp17529_c0_seq1:2818-3723(+)
MTRWVVLNGSAITIPSNVSTVASISELASKKLCRAAERLTALPHPLRPLVVLVPFERCSQLHVLVVSPTPIQRLEPTLGAQQPCFGLTVPKGIDLPGPARNGSRTEILQEKLVATRGLVNHFGVKWGCFIVHTPCAVDEFELTVLDKAAGQVTTLVWLLVPPPSKEANLNVDKVSVGVFKQLIHNGVYHVVNFVEEVLVHSYLPTSIVMRVRNKMHVDLCFVDPGFFVRRIVFPVGRIRIRRVRPIVQGKIPPPRLNAKNHRQKQQHPHLTVRALSIRTITFFVSFLQTTKRENLHPTQAL